MDADLRHYLTAEFPGDFGALIFEKQHDLVKCLSKVHVLTQRKQEQEELCKKLASELKDVQSKPKTDENKELERKLTQDLFDQACGARYFADELKVAEEEKQKAIEKLDPLLALREHLPLCPVLNSVLSPTEPA